MYLRDLGTGQVTVVPGLDGIPVCVADRVCCPSLFDSDLISKIKFAV